MALSYPASNSKVTCSALTQMGTPTQVTCLTWCYPTTIAGSGRISQKGLAAGVQWFHTFSGSGTALDVEIGRATTFAQATAAVADFTWWGLNKWVCIVTQVDTVTAGNTKLLVGDQLNLVAEPSSYSKQTAGVGTITPWGTDVYTIGNKTNDNNPFQGLIGVQMIWNRLLSLQELYAQQFRPRPSFGCVGAWAPGSNGALDVLDYSGYGNHGTITAALPTSDHIPRLGRIFVPKNWRVA